MSIEDLQIRREDFCLALDPAIVLGLSKKEDESHTKKPRTSHAFESVIVRSRILSTMHPEKNSLMVFKGAHIARSVRNTASAHLQTLIPKSSLRAQSVAKFLFATHS